MVDLTVAEFRCGLAHEVQPRRLTSRSRDAKADGGEWAVDHNAAALLVELDRFEQRLEISFTEAFVALALDHFEENRADGVLGEDLQENAALGTAVDQDVPSREFG